MHDSVVVIATYVFSIIGSTRKTLRSDGCCRAKSSLTTMVRCSSLILTHVRDSVHTSLWNWTQKLWAGWFIIHDMLCVQLTGDREREKKKPACEEKKKNICVSNMPPVPLTQTQMREREGGKAYSIKKRKTHRHVPWLDPGNNISSVSWSQPLPDTPPFCLNCPPPHTHTPTAPVSSSVSPIARPSLPSFSLSPLSATHPPPSLTPVKSIKS